VKAGTDDKKKTIIATVLFVLALAAVAYQLMPSSSPASAKNTPTANPALADRKAARTTPVFSKLDPSLRLDLLKGSEQVSYNGSGRDIFHSQPEVKPTPEAKDPRRNPEPPKTTGPPPKPPINLKFYGFASTNDKKQVFLAQGEDVFVAAEGDIVKGRYKVVHVNPANVEIEDVLSSYSQTIPLSIPNS
jgi:hypothetical protein